MFGFEDILENELVKEALSHSILNNTLNHAYILEGERGIGKMTLVKAVAKAVLCENEAVEGRPCGRCSSCVSFETNNNPDVIYPEKSKSAFTVDDVRNMVSDAVIKPFKYRYKVYIVKEAYLMNVQAQNALLKTIEEPPEYAVFFLLCENSSVFLPTILSRCITLKLRPVSLEGVEGYLAKKLGIDRAGAKSFASYSQGNIGRALEIAGSERFIEMRQDILSLIKDLQKADLVETLALVSRLEKYKDNIGEALDIMLGFYRDIYIYKTTQSADSIIQADKSQDIISLADKSSERALSYMTNAIVVAKNDLKRFVSFQLVLENLFLNYKSSLFKEN